MTTDKEQLLYESDKGELCEGMRWEILMSTETWANSACCQHCSPQETVVHTRRDGSMFTRLRGQSGPVIVAYNEGGHNATKVCLLCVLNAAYKIGLIGKTELGQETGEDRSKGS